MAKKEVTIGGGCFWCTEAIFSELKGVISVESGYSGGHQENPTYEEVTSGLTGHAEVVQIAYNNDLIALEEIITIHLTTHDPCTINRQGGDIGTQYRSIIFYNNVDEKRKVEEIIEKMQHTLKSPIVTEVVPFSKFYKAEAYHQKYYSNNPSKGYCNIVIHPKLNKFRKLYVDKLK